MKIRTIALLSLLAAAAAFMSGCNTVGRPKDLDATGRIPTGSMYGKINVNVTKAEACDLKEYKPMILVLGSKFFKDQTAKVGFFEKVVDRQGMEQLLIQEGKSEIVTDVTNLLSWKKIADNYKRFIVLKPDIREEGRHSFAQLKVIQADTAKEVFVAEVKLDFMWKGVNDDTVFYPLYNSFLDWCDKNK